MAEARRILLEFPDDRTSAHAILLEDSAPRTCRAVWEHLPLESSMRHGIYSGSEVYALWPATFVVEPENATSNVLPGDIGYYHVPGGVYYGLPDEYCEICVFYDRDAVPSLSDGPIRVNVFARLTGDTGPFFDTCRRMRLEGRKAFRVSALAP